MLQHKNKTFLLIKEKHMFSLSPAVTTREIDLSAVVGAAPSSFSAFAGKFNWGPVNQPMLVADEKALTSTFGTPDTYTATDFFTMASFFAYSSGAWVSRIGPKATGTLNNLTGGMRNAVYPSGVDVSVLNATAQEEAVGSLSAVTFYARYPGAVGNGISVSVCATPAQYKLVLTSEFEDEFETSVALKFDDTNGKSIKSKRIPVTGGDAHDIMSAGDTLVIDGVKYGVERIMDAEEIVEVTGEADVFQMVLLDRIYVGSGQPSEVARYWKYYEQVSGAPRSDTEFHLVVVDTDGYFQRAGAILETYEFLSTEKSALDDQLRSSYWERVLNKSSNFLYAGEGTPDLGASSLKSVTAQLTGGDDARAETGLDEYIVAYEAYLNAELYDTPILIAGNAITSNTETGAVLANFLTRSIAEVRKDTLVFVSPPLEAVFNNSGREAESCVAARKLLGSSSYATMDGNWKYMYDKYNDTFRWIPCSGDHAGLYAQNDRERDPWVSPAGTSKGRMKNVTKFAWNPDKTARDVLYQNDVNPMFVMALAGPVLFGDKTLLGKNTALSRNNVRRLLIVLEKTIATAAVDMLFEFNDEFTQRRFKSMIEPFLKDAQGRRGLTDFKVICDATVNTPQVVQNNSFVGQIYFKPNYTISDIRLDFVVVNASASFEEVIGSY